MRRLAGGRQADVYDLGDGRVLRRYRTARTALREAEVMRLARAHGYPVPRVDDATETELVMERVDGPTMLDELARRRWTLWSHAGTLAALHNRLHRIGAPSELRAPFGDGAALIHLDLHPENVLLSERGPVVIDWPAAARGVPADDVAQTWLLVGCSIVPGARLTRLVLRTGRDLFLRAFLSRFDRAEVVRRLPAVAALRDRDENVLDSEREAIRRLVADVSSRP